MAFDNALNFTGNSVATVTQAYTVGTGTNRILLLWIAAYTTTDIVSTVKYAGVSMTRVTLYNSGINPELYLYYLTAPASGSNNIVITFNTLYRALAFGAASYDNSIQTGLTNTVGRTQTGGTSFTNTITTLVNNSWLAMGVNDDVNNQFLISAGAGSTTRGGSSNYFWFGDSNAALTPVGSKTMTVTTAASDNFTGLMVEIPPPTSSLKPRLMTLGMG